MTASDPSAEQAEVNDKNGFILVLRIKDAYVGRLKHLYRQTRKTKTWYLFLHKPNWTLKYYFFGDKLVTNAHSKRMKIFLKQKCELSLVLPQTIKFPELNITASYIFLIKKRA